MNSLERQTLETIKRFAQDSIKNIDEALRHTHTVRADYEALIHDAEFYLAASHDLASKLKKVVCK